MARRLDSTDRKGKSREMLQRKLRLTEQENEQLNKLLKLKETNLRDTVVNLVLEELKKFN